jgi:hypothetical protein
MKSLSKALMAMAILGMVAWMGSPLQGEGPEGKQVQTCRNPGVYPVTAKPCGKTYEEWSILWWQWAEAIPFGVNPVFNDKTGIHGSIGQSGPVWFLAGAGGGEIKRTVTVPLGKPLFFPISNWINDYPCPPSDPPFEPPAGKTLEVFLQEYIGTYVEMIDVLECEVDGKPLKDLFDYRVISGLFPFTAAADIGLTGDPCTTGSPQLATSDGYWVMLRPLPPGEHVIHFRGGVSAWGPVLDVTYNLMVEKPKGNK